MKFHTIVKMGIVVGALFALQREVCAAPSAAQVESTLAKKNLNVNDIGILKGYGRSVVDSYRNGQLEGNDININLLQDQYALMLRIQKRLQGKIGSVEINGQIKALQGLVQEADRKEGNRNLLQAALEEVQPTKQGSKRPSRPSSKPSSPLSSSKPRPVGDLITVSEEHAPAPAKELFVVDINASPTPESETLTFSPSMPIDGIGSLPEKPSAPVTSTDLVLLSPDKSKAELKDLAALSDKVEASYKLALDYKEQPAYLFRYLKDLGTYYTAISSAQNSSNRLLTSSPSSSELSLEKKRVEVEKKVASDIASLIKDNPSQILYSGEIWDKASSNKLATFTYFGTLNDAVSALNKSGQTIAAVYGSKELMKIVQDSSDTASKNKLVDEFVNYMSILINSFNNIAEYLATKNIPGEASDRTKLEFYLQILYLLDTVMVTGLSTEVREQAAAQMDKKYMLYSSGVIPDLISEGLGISFISDNKKFKAAMDAFNKNWAPNKTKIQSAIQRLNALPAHPVI